METLFPDVIAIIFAEFVKIYFKPFNFEPN